MYAFLIGKIDSKSENTLVINCNGVGYEVFASNDTLSSIGAIGDTVKIYTYLHVREDVMQLFGFLNLQEKQMFLNLTTVSGVGAKTAIVVLSSVKLEDLVQAIVLGDTSLISRAKGIGKKTAERIVLELKDKLSANITVDDILGSSTTSENLTTIPSLEAIDLLCAMGLTKFDASNLVKQVASNGDTTEQIVAKALRNMR